VIVSVRCRAFRRFARGLFLRAETSSAQTPNFSNSERGACDNFRHMMIGSRWRRSLRSLLHHRLGLIGVSGLLAFCSLFGQVPARTTSAPENQKMKSFVLIFRQGAKPLSDDDRKQINPQMPGWAARQRESGRNLDPRILAEGPSQTLSGHGASAPASVERPVTALLFIEAEDFQDAVRVAESHPGLGYDISVEVRAWAPPVPAPVAAR
jgi:hypothetical protein